MSKGELNSRSFDESTVYIINRAPVERIAREDKTPDVCMSDKNCTTKIYCVQFEQTRLLAHFRSCFLENDVCGRR